MRRTKVKTIQGVKTRIDAIQVTSSKFLFFFIINKYMGKQVTDSCSRKIREKKRVEYIQTNQRKIRPPFASPPVSVAIIRIPEHRQAPPYLRRHWKLARNDHTKPQFLVQCATTISAIRRIFDQPPPAFYASTTTSKSDLTTAPELPRPASKFAGVVDFDPPHPPTGRHYHSFHGSLHGLKFLQSNNDG